MALVAASPAFRLSVQLVASNSKTMSVNVPLVAANYADAVTAATAFLVDLNAISAGVVKSYTISSVAVEDALVLPTGADAEYGDRALITGQIAGNPLKMWTLYVPMPVIDIFVATGGLNMDVIDITDALVTAYVANYTATGDIATVSDGELVDTILNGRRVN